MVRVLEARVGCVCGHLTEKPRRLTSQMAIYVFGGRRF